MHMVYLGRQKNTVSRYMQQCVTCVYLKRWGYICIYVGFIKHMIWNFNNGKFLIKMFILFNICFQESMSYWSFCVKYIHGLCPYFEMLWNFPLNYDNFIISHCTFFLHNLNQVVFLRKCISKTGWITWLPSITPSPVDHFL